MVVARQGERTKKIGQICPQKTGWETRRLLFCCCILAEIPICFQREACVYMMVGIWDMVNGVVVYMAMSTIYAYPGETRTFLNAERLLESHSIGARMYINIIVSFSFLIICVFQLILFGVYILDVHAIWTY